ncbi:MAG: CHAT domain-containing protein [Hyellaceae cyanobacterium CSU_1_1]|nr:CHAT domain-containing protein [Pleurocapsa sp. CRU_1_2]NJR46105.1 CHAT domain-containing protein [Hyellaceae cyanobacterium CSU_1_1]
MPFKLRRSYLLLFVVIIGLSMSFLPNKLAAVFATVPTEQQIVATKSAAQLETQGKHFYSISQFQQAVDLWQQAIEIYDPKDSLGRARVMSNLALAQSQLSNWSQATANINASLKLLRNDPKLSETKKVRAVAQVLNNQGILQLNQGEAEQAIATWQQAQVSYQQVGDESGVIRTSINQASAFKQLGLYRRALNSLTEVSDVLKQQSDSELKVAGLRSYGDILRLVGEVKRSQEVLRSSLTIATRLDSADEQSKILLLLGNTYKTHQPDQALKFYQQGLATCQQQDNCWQTDLPLQIYLAQLNTSSSAPPLPWQQDWALVTQIKAELARLPVNRTNIDRRLNFAHSWLELVKVTHKWGLKQSHIADIEQFLAATIEQAKTIAYPQAQSYSLGLRGQIREKLKDWENAQQYTQEALILAQGINAPEVSYLWQWQLGRINQALGESTQAIANYTQAVELLQSLSRDLVAINPDVQYSFRDSVEPVYRGLVSLLLESDAGESIAQSSLEKAREVMESLQLAELNHFFREACLDAQEIDIDRLDPQAAVIYPIILSDRLEVILSLPNQPLQHYSHKISQAQLEQVIKQFRHHIVIRSRRDFYRSAQKLYDLVIRPAVDGLSKNAIKTLVIVPDGAFANIPFSAMFDGQHYLIEDYSIALTPGLQLLNPRSLTQVKLKTLIAGLTEKVDGFAGLEYVTSELKEIASRIDSRVLVNQDFTSEALKQEIQYSDYPLVHIATHGQFSSSLEDTFLLAWDERININELDSILKGRNGDLTKAIELLVLSACETAAGDNRAALGMAGMAVRAGAKSTLATLWSVNDQATAKLMSSFYQELLAQLPKAEAVRQAQLKLLHNRWYKHPFYWASYVLLGNWL